jgi:hypothetical protein
LLITLFTRAHHWSLLKPNPVHTFPFSFLILYCTVIIFITRRMYFCQTLFLIWQLAASAAVFNPWLAIMSASLFTSRQYGQWCQLQTLFFTP